MQGPDPSEAGPSGASAPSGSGGTSAYAAASPSTPQPAALSTTQSPYYNYPPQTWAQTNQWHAYNPQQGAYYSQNYAPYYTATSHRNSGGFPPSQPAAAEQSKPRSPTPPPPPPYRKHWDDVIKRFLEAAGLTQALRGFESDMLVLSSEWEEKKVPAALATLREDLVRLDILGAESPLPLAEESLDERKLQHTHFMNGVEPRTPSTITKAISQFLAQNRARNDASNRREFLLSLGEKKQRLSEANRNDTAVPGPSCARTDARTQDRDIQMKYDIAKNEDGPLKKTMKREHELTTDETVPSSKVKPSEEVIADRYPGLDERLRNVETHVAVRYVPAPPRSLLDRLKFLEDHLIQLEKEYPPWAALHFNQPRRGWPPPPRPTPIIVPSHLTAATEPTPKQTSTLGGITSTDSSEPGPSKSRGKATGRSGMSSLQRAVMERLEVQKAMNDLGGVKAESDS